MYEYDRLTIKLDFEFIITKQDKKQKSKNINLIQNIDGLDLLK